MTNPPHIPCGHAETLESCFFCRVALGRPKYAAFWSKAPAPPAREKKTTTALPARPPCTYEGTVVEEARCGCEKKAVRVCWNDQASESGYCTRGPNSGAHPSCQSCPFYTSSEGVTHS